MSRSPRSNVRRLAIGRLISVTGGAAAYTALMFTVWNDTHSATWQSVALLLTFGVVGILSPLTGHLGDRFDRMASTGLYTDGQKGIFRPTTPALRLQDQERDGIQAEVIYGPTPTSSYLHLRQRRFRRIENNATRLRRKRLRISGND